ncbi:ATP-binding protein [Chitinophaga vietnamensis]|uniref:ATP-binding protein n=1 Tax=Chitinophaga vietnamensis TaxID=2593957 RepID=UPI0013762001|nr:tetratricopeptide repeat protein [Chitinophaga vietnamensis]
MLQGQTARQESLLRRLQQLPPDTVKVNTLLAYGESVLPDSIRLAERYFLQALDLSRQLGYHKGVADFTFYYMYIQDLRGEYMRSLYLLQQALQIYISQQDTAGLVLCINYIGNEYQNVGNYQQAANSYLYAMKLADITGDSLTAVKMATSLAGVFIRLGDPQKGFDYARRAYQFGVQHQKPRRMAAALVNMGIATAKMKKYPEAEQYFQHAMQLGRELGDSTFVLDALINNAGILSDQGQHPRALQLYEQALAITQKYAAPDYLIYVYLGYGQELFKLKRYALAEQYLNKTITLGQLYQSGDELRQAYLAASDLKAAQGQPLQALQLRRSYEVLNDSLVGDATRKNVQQLEIQYLSEKKDRDLAEKKLELAQKDLQLQQKNMWIVIGFISIIALLAAAFVAWQKMLYRQHLQQQQLQTLQVEKTVQVLEAMMQGEERERRRLSNDLHDGVGGLLSAVKMHFSALKHERPILQRDEDFNHAMGMLDDAISEVRKTAHNLMPEMLARLGLAEALSFYCRNVSHSRNLQITFYGAGNIQRFKANFELSVYRIIQELINNIIKHSRATAALVQLTQHERLLTITVEDNGIGFQHQPELQSGIGLKSLQSRIRALNGSLEIAATAGRGTSAYIEFNIDLMQFAEA